MKLNQLSVFLENKTGRINDMCSVLTNADINMKAFSLAESAEFGIMRILVSDVEQATKVLRNSGFTCTVTEVICIEVADKAGELNSILNALSGKDIFIEYMYAFSQNECARVVIKPTDIEGCIEALVDSNHKVIKKTDIF